MPYLSSAGIAREAPGYGTTCRKDVLGGVEVPVVPGAGPCGRPSFLSRCVRGIGFFPGLKAGASSGRPGDLI